MKALVYTGQGGPNVIAVREVETPKPKPGEVGIKVSCSGINFADIMARQGLYPDRPALPCVVGYEVSGVIDALGEGVDAKWLGKRVMAATRFGGYAEYACTSVLNCMHMPEDWSFEEGAAVPVAYGTAYAALVLFGNTKPDENVVVHSAAGGVGMAATQIAKMLGARVLGTSSKSKHDFLRKNGVDIPIDYANEDVRAVIKRETGGKGADVILDARGGKAFKESYVDLAVCGRLVMYGAGSILSGEKRSIGSVLRTLVEMPKFKAMSLTNRTKSVAGLNMLCMWDAWGNLEKLTKVCGPWFLEGKLRPVVHQSFKASDVASAHSSIVDRKNVGKVVLDWS
jgi:synaptic vesicle membrane protein VAT-1